MALITTIGEFKKYVDVDANANIVTLTPYIQEAEQLFLVDLIGQSFYDEFAALYALSVVPSPTPLSPDNLALLPYLQRCIAYYAQMLALPHLAVTFGDMGMRQHRADDSDAAPRWLQDQLRTKALRSGDTHADKLLEFLEKNATGSKYATWFTSTYNTKNSGYIIYNTHIASKHIEISNSRRIFLKLRSTIQEIERRFVPRFIGQAQYDELVSQLKAGSLTTINQQLITKIEPMVCKRALFMRLPYLRVSVADDGLWLYSDVSELRSKDFLATAAELKELRVDLMDGDLGYMADEQELRQFILDNIDDYQLIKASAVYTVQPDPGPMWTPANDPNNKHFIV